MESLLTAVVAVAGLLPAEGATFLKASKGKVEAAIRSVNSVVKKTNGRVLATLVREGMPSERIHQILGREYTTFIISSGPQIIILDAYPYLGLYVYYNTDKAGDCRVERVHFSGD